MKKSCFLGLCILANALHASPDGTDTKHLLDFSLEYSGNSLIGKVSYVYDSNFLVKEKIQQAVDPENPTQLQNNTRELFGYDSLQREILHENYVWSDAVFDYIGKPSVDARTETTYTPEGKVAQINYYQWNESTSTWAIHTRGTYTYHQDSGTETRYKQVNGIWQNDPYERYDFVYNAQGLPVEKAVYSYMFDFMSYEYKWIPLDLTRFDYDKMGNIIREESYNMELVSEEDPWEGEDPWDPWGDGDEWDPWAKQKVAARKDSVALSLLYRYKHEYTYDEYGNVLTRTDSTWSDLLQAYELTNQIRYDHHYILANDYLELPWSSDFASNSGLDGFESTDGNEDGQTWQIENGSLRCHNTNTSVTEDILFLPTLHLTTDFEIRLNLLARVQDSTQPARLRVVLCHPDEENTEAEILADSLVIRQNTFQDQDLYFIPEKEGNYKLALCFDNAYESILEIDSIRVENHRSSLSPEPPYNLTAIPARDGSLQVQLSWFAPIYTIHGDYLRYVDSMEVYRQDVEKPIHCTGPLNSSLESRFVDQSAIEGLNRYRIIAYAGGLPSQAAEIEVIVGIAAASAPGNFQALENEDHSVQLSWNTPENAEGNLTYTLIRNNAVIVAQGLKDTLFTDRIECPEGQTYVYYALYPFNEGGQGSGAFSSLLFIGESTAAPFTESFAGGTAQHQWMNEIVSGYDAAWGTGPQASSPEASPCDEDGGLASFMVGETANIGDAVRFSSEKIDVRPLKNPVLRFHMYHTTEAKTPAALLVEVSRANGSYQKVSDTLSVGGAQTEGWQEHAVDLSHYAGEQNLRISFLGFSDLKTCIHIDQISITEKQTVAVPSDLSVQVLKDSVTLSWKGSEDLLYTLRLYRKGNETPILEQNGIACPGGKSETGIGQLENGDYTWTVQAFRGPESSQTVEGPAFKVEESRNGIPVLADFKIYPNPTQGDFQIETLPGSRIEIYRTNGQLVLRFETSRSTTPMFLNQNGLYIVKATKDGMVSVQKLIVR